MATWPKFKKGASPKVGRHSAVDTASRCVLDGATVFRWPNPHPSRLNLGPIQLPVKIGTGSLSGGNAAEAWRWPPTNLTPRLKKEYSYTTTPPLGRHGVFYDEFYLSHLKNKTFFSSMHNVFENRDHNNNKNHEEIKISRLNYEILLD